MPSHRVRNVLLVVDENSADPLMFPQPVMPSELVSDSHPALKRFLGQQVDMQIADLRLLFRLPDDALDPSVGCNLTTTAVLLNLISGFSVWLYETDEARAIRSEEVKDGRRRSKRRFLGFVTEYWPQISPEGSPDDVATRLYEVRNSLVHDLGVSDESSQEEHRSIRLAKRPMSLQEIVERELSVGHPLPVPVIEENGDVITVHLGGVYWALHRMLREALSKHANEIETTIAAISMPEIETLPTD